jgi:hypothetical protein
MKKLILVCLILFAAGIALADSLSSSIRVHVVARHVSTSGATDASEVIYGRTLTSGHSTDQADRTARYAGTVATSAPVSLDLVAGIADSFGGVATFSTARALSVRNESLTNAIGITGALGSFTVGADGCALMAAPLDGLTPGTITVSLATGTPASFSILIIGTSQ